MKRRPGSHRRMKGGNRHGRRCLGNSPCKKPPSGVNSGGGALGLWSSARKRRAMSGFTRVLPSSQRDKEYSACAY